MRKTLLGRVVCAATGRLRSCLGNRTYSFEEQIAMYGDYGLTCEFACAPASMWLKQSEGSVFCTGVLGVQK